MKNQMILAVSLALALAAPAFAQDSSPSIPAATATDQAAPAASQSMSSDQQTRHHRTKHRQAGQHYDPAYMALTGNEPKDVAYQYSDQQKSYPAVDHGHVPGDPPVINHQDDQAPVNPTKTTITVPPSG